MSEKHSNSQKTIGTTVPLTALSSEKFDEKGTFGAGIAFLDWLRKTEQNAWQLLPIHQTPLEPGSNEKHIPSPYKNYGVGLNTAYLSGGIKTPEPNKEELAEFKLKHADWLPNYALFCSLRDKFETDDWTLWPEDIRTRKVEAMGRYKEEVADEIKKHIEMQWKLDFQYHLLRKKAHEYGISLIGDCPFYICLQSPLVWANQELFDLTSDGKMTRVSGLPNGPKSHWGRQVWGHPLYKWEGYREGLVRFWKMRLRNLSHLFDWVRLDHAKGFFAYGVIDLEDEAKDCFKQALEGEILEQLINYAREKGLNIFAENSGTGTRRLMETLDKLKVPGIRLLRYAISEKNDDGVCLKYANVPDYHKNTFACTTTHDTETLLGYLELLSVKQKKVLADHVSVGFSEDNKELAVRLRTAVIESPANWVLIPIQDWLLTTDRINVPGTEKEVGDENWRYEVETCVEDLAMINEE
ncbi:MAG: 4-alpha-glucanotransferase [Candidatus Peregrinibacteria bacterium]|nr:4-alpha-glucanotransferase [Candidatus Peregrinibacteria bacterium]